MAQNVEAEETNDAARAATDKAAGAAAQLVHRPAATSEGVAERSTAAAEQLAALPRWAAAELFRADGSFARIWAELAGAWITRDATMRRRLAETRDWREVTEIHEEFTRDSLGRMAEAVERCFDLQLEMVNRLVAASGEEQARKAA